jgi:hypothetical protein
VQCGEAESSCCLHLTEVTGQPGLGSAASAVAPTRGTAEVSRSRNLGQTVDNIQDNFIHYKDISMIIIFKMFIHKQNKWKYNEHMSLFSDMVIWLKKYYIISTIL